MVRVLVSARIFQEPARWDLPSLSVPCTIAQCVLRLARVPYVAVDASPGRNLPVVELIFADGSKVVLHGLDQVLRGLNDCGKDIDQPLTAIQRAEAAAFAAMLEESDTARLWEWWVVGENFYGSTKQAYGAPYRFPLSEIYPRRVRGRELQGQSIPDDEELLLAQFERTVRCVESRLGSHKWLLGEAPCTLDAFAFGYLGACLAAPMPSDSLRTILSRYPSVVHYLERITATVFDGDSAEGFIEPETTPQRPRKSPSRSPEAQAAHMTSMRYYFGMLLVFFGYMYIQDDDMEDM